MVGSKHDLLILRDWSANAPYRLARRAWLISKLLEGQSTKSLAASVAMTEQRVEEIAHRYKEFGLVGLFEAPRSGRPPRVDPNSILKLVSDGQIYQQDQIATKVASTKQVSEHTIWRISRSKGKQINRVRNQHRRLHAKLNESFPLIACVIQKDFQLFVLGSSFRMLRVLEPMGVLDSASKVLLSATDEFSRKKKATYIEDVFSIAATYGGDIPIRASQERRRRLVDNLNQVHALSGIPGTIYAAGDIRSKSFCDWINALNGSVLFSVDPKLRFNLFPSTRNLIGELKEIAQGKNGGQELGSTLSQSIFESIQEEIVWYRIPET